LIPERNGAEMERIYRKHMKNKLDIYLFSALLMGGGVLLWLSYIGGTPKHSPFRCNKLTALPERRLMGWTRRSMKNRPLEMRWKRAWVD